MSYTAEPCGVGLGLSFSSPNPLLLRAATDLCVTAGAGESGKSTILKQMKLIYSQGFSKSERLDWKPVVFSNIVQSFRTINEAMSELNYDFDNPDNEVRLTHDLVQFASYRMARSNASSCSHAHG